MTTLPIGNCLLKNYQTTGSSCPSIFLIVLASRSKTLRDEFSCSDKVRLHFEVHAVPGLDGQELNLIGLVEILVCVDVICSFALGCVQHVRYFHPL